MFNCFSLLLFVGLDRTQNTKGIKMHMDNNIVASRNSTIETFGSHVKQYNAMYTIMVCSLPLKFVEFSNQLVFIKNNT